MHPKHSEHMMIVMLNDVSRYVLPRVVAMQTKLEQGQSLNDSEIILLSTYLNKLGNCLSNYALDERGRIVFAAIVRLLVRVTELALRHERNELNPA